MATIYIEEYGDIMTKMGHVIDVPDPPLSRTQLTVSTTSARTSFDFDNRTKFVVLLADTDSLILFGDDTVEATQNSIILPANTFRSFTVQRTKRVAGILKT